MPETDTFIDFCEQKLSEVENLVSLIPPSGAGALLNQYLPCDLFGENPSVGNPFIAAYGTIDCLARTAHDLQDFYVDRLKAQMQCIAKLSYALSAYLKSFSEITDRSMGDEREQLRMEAEETKLKIRELKARRPGIRNAEEQLDIDNRIKVYHMRIQELRSKYRKLKK